MKDSSFPKIVVASKNPVKLRAVEEGFYRMYPDLQKVELTGVVVDSGVNDQPLSSEETLKGALNRALKAKSQVKNANFWIGIEGGIELGDQLSAFAWVVVVDNNRVGKSRTATFYLPDRVAQLIRQGKELGEADDLVFGESNSKQKSGAVGLLTHNTIDRTAYYTEAVILALIPFKNPQLY